MFYERDDYFNKNTSSTGIINLVNVIYDDEFVQIINKLSNSIKSYFKITKKTISELNDNLTNLNNDLLFSKNIINDISSNNLISKNESLPERIESILKIKGKIDNNVNHLDTNLISFFDEAKKLFKEMKTTRLRKKNEIINNIETKNKKNISAKKKFNTININRTLDFNNTSLNISNSKKIRSKSESSNQKNNSMKIKKKFLHHGIILTKSNFDLSLNVIKFLENLVEIQDDILNNSLNLKDKKIKFEIEKKKLREQAKSIINNDTQLKEKFHSLKIKKLYEENNLITLENEKNEKIIENLKKKILKLENKNNKLSNEKGIILDKSYSSVEKGKIFEKIKKKNMKNIQSDNSQSKDEYQKLNQQYNNLSDKFLDTNQKFEKSFIELNKKCRNKENDLSKQIKYERDKNLSLEKMINEKDKIIKELMKLLSELKIKKENHLIKKNLYTNDKINEINLSEHVNYILENSNLKKEIEKLKLKLQNNKNKGVRKNSINSEEKDCLIENLKKQNESLLGKIKMKENEIIKHKNKMNKEKEKNKKTILLKEEMIEKLNNLILTQKNKIISLEKELLESENEKLESIKQDSNLSLLNKINDLQKKYKSEKDYNEILIQTNNNFMEKLNELQDSVNNSALKVSEIEELYSKQSIKIEDFKKSIILSKKIEEGNLNKDIIIKEPQEKNDKIQFNLNQKLENKNNIINEKKSNNDENDKMKTIELNETNNKLINDKLNNSLKENNESKNKNLNELIDKESKINLLTIENLKIKDELSQTNKINEEKENKLNEIKKEKESLLEKINSLLQLNENLNKEIDNQKKKN